MFDPKPPASVPKPAVSSSQDLPAAPTPPRKRRHTKRIVLIASAVILVTGAGVAAWAFTHRPAPHVASKPSPTPKPTPTPTPTPVTKFSPLTGLPVTPAQADQPIIGVIIENHPDARPQSGLQDAGVVYEANAEGGITRFEAFFLENRPAAIGPVRSLRTYFLDWGLEFNAPVAHAGGNADALDEVTPLGMKDLNALSFASSGFYRTTDRIAPHNLYTSGAKLDTLLARYSFTGPATFTPSPRKADTPTQAPAHPNIHIDYSYSGYQVDYKYDATTNDYARYLSGQPHVDRNTGKQIHVKNIVVEMMPTSYGYTRIGESTVIMQTVGQGQGYVIRDGTVVPCTWVKDSRGVRTKLLDASGADIPLDAGNTWYSIVPVGKSVTF
ncbi:MAG TPA: DUF3048 domain-containing protein [Candidatus Saccharimonadia bacterium]|jgi:hypothetical protein|nr:DUF3048 domain-containing protein [Candidatus Saccharimonadia bacterium]